MTEKTFYMTYSRSRPNELIPWIEANNVPILTNSLHRWSESREAFLDMWEYDTEHVIDAGGYNVQSNYADRWGNLKEEQSTINQELSTNAPFYPWTVEQYHDWCNTHADELEWATVMDYACEERFDGLWSVEDRIDATIRTTKQQWHMDREYNLLPVLQGKTVEQYVDCAERLESAGVDISHAGIGTVCRLSNTNDIVRIAREVRERTNIETVHGFGVKINAYKKGAEFDTADSHAWVYTASNGHINCLSRTDDDGLRLDSYEMTDDSLTRTVHSFKTYYAYVTWLMTGESRVDVDDIIAEQASFDIPKA